MFLGHVTQTEAAVWAYALRLQLKAIELGKRLLEASVNHVWTGSP